MEDKVYQYLIGLSLNFLLVIRSSVQFFSFTPHHGLNKFTFPSLQSSLASSKPGKLELERPGNSLSSRIHLSNPQASHYIASFVKACLTQCTKRKSAIVDHHYTILCFPQANSAVSLLVKLVFICMFFVQVCACVRVRDRDRWLRCSGSEEPQGAQGKAQTTYIFKAERIFQHVMSLHFYLFLFLFFQQ